MILFQSLWKFKITWPLFKKFEISIKWIRCGRKRGTCLCEITSRPETEYGTKQCMQSRHMMPETNQCIRYVFASGNCATQHPERCMCWNGRDQTGNQWGPLSIWTTPCREKAEILQLLLASCETCLILS